MSKCTYMYCGGAHIHVITMNHFALVNNSILLKVHAPAHKLYATKPMRMCMECNQKVCAVRACNLSVRQCKRVRTYSNSAKLRMTSPKHYYNLAVFKITEIPMCVDNFRSSAPLTSSVRAGMIIQKTFGSY